MGLQIKKIRNKDRKGILMNTFIDLKRCEQEKDLRKKRKERTAKNFRINF